MESLRDPVVIGVVVGAPHGVRGTLRVRPTGSGQHLREGMEPVLGGIRRKILTSRQTPKGFLVDIEGAENREEAGAFRGEELTLDRAELDALDEDELYASDLHGLVAVEESGEELGTVAETFETPAHEVLVIRTLGGELYVPFTFEHVPEVDLRAGRMVVVPPKSEE